MSLTVKLWFVVLLSFHADAVLKYQVYRERLKWSDAERHCQKVGGHLATVKNGDENRLLAAKLKRNNVVTAWIGLSDESSEGLWTWVSSHSNYSNFQPGEPNGGKNENCVEMMSYKGNWNGTWNDGHCDGKNAFICEYVDKCATDKPCHTKALCLNTEGTYKCTCICGYEGDGKTCTESNSYFQNNAIKRTSPYDHLQNSRYVVL